MQTRNRRRVRPPAALQSGPVMSVLYAEDVESFFSSAAERVAGMSVPRSPVAWSYDPANIERQSVEMPSTVLLVV